MEKLVKAQTLTYSVYENCINTLKENFDSLKVATCGKSLLDKEIYALVIGEGSRNILYVGGTHGAEWLTSLALLRFCEDLLRCTQNEGTMAGYCINDILKEIKLIIIPELNPDGIEIAIKGSSACGKYIKSDVEVCKGNFDVWSANARGVDINHNFNADWYTLRDFEKEKGIGGPAPRRFGGCYPESEPETQAITRICRNIPVSLLMAFHSQGEEIYYEYGKYTPPKSYTIAKALAGVSEYKLVKNEGHAASGGLKDWFIEEFMKPAFTIEIGKGANPLPVSQFEDIYNSVKSLMVMGLIL